jgi:plastocyanin
MRGRGRLALVGAVLGVVAVVAGCSGSSGNSGGSNAAANATTAASTTTTSGGGNEIKLTAQNIKFDKTSLQIASGAQITVEVTNKDKIEHNFTFRAANASKDVEGGEDATVKFTAPAAGTYEFHCKYHPSVMKGTITVT